MARKPLKIDSISLPIFKSILARYEQHIPVSLHDLDIFRSETLPQQLQERRKAYSPPPQSRSFDSVKDSRIVKKSKKKKDAPKLSKPQGAHLTKDELVKLVEWKLYVKLSFLFQAFGWNSKFENDHKRIKRTHVFARDLMHFCNKPDVQQCSAKRVARFLI
jgi:hypothetical protein